MQVKRGLKRAGGMLAVRALGRLIALPGSFLGGLLVGLAAPVATLAGIASGVYLFTKKVPFFRYEPANPETGARALTFELMPPAEAQEALGAWRAELGETWSVVQKEMAQVEAEMVDSEP